MYRIDKAQMIIKQLQNSRIRHVIWDIWKKKTNID